jgi:hypothetical protein
MNTHYVVVWGLNIQCHKSLLTDRWQKVQAEHVWWDLGPSKTESLLRLAISKSFSIKSNMSKITVPAPLCNSFSTYHVRAVNWTWYSVNPRPDSEFVRMNEKMWVFTKQFLGHYRVKKNEYSLSGCLRPQHSVSHVSFHRQMVESSSRTCLMRFRAFNNWIIFSASHFEEFFNKIKQV